MWYKSHLITVYNHFYIFFFIKWSMGGGIFLLAFRVLKKFILTTFDAALWRRGFSGRCESQFSSVAQSCLTLCNTMDCSTPALSVHHKLPEFTQTHIHWVSDAIQSSHPLSSLSPPAFNLSQHQGLFQWVSSSHQVAKVLDFQLQHQFFEWIFRTDFP